MKRSKRQRLWDPYRKVIDRLNRQGVAYVVVGMAGINYYAKNAAEMFATVDYDLFLEPTLHNVEKAVQLLSAMGFTLTTAKGPFTREGLRQPVRNQETFVAATPEGVTVELLLRVSGYPFSEMARDAATFTVDGVPVRVGKLTKLLNSKRTANRPKDRQFLRRYQSLLEHES